MSAITNFTQLHQFYSAFERYVSAYQQVTVQQLKKRRDSVINNRAQAEGLIDVFVDLKRSMQLMSEHDHSISFSTLSKNGKSALVFLSFETRFARGAILDAFQRFLELSQKQDHAQSTQVIVGSVGKQLSLEHFGESNSSLREFIELREANLSTQAIAPIVMRLLSFEHVTIVSPFFQNLVSQPPREISITGDVPIQSTGVTTEPSAFLFEPQADAILAFFELQIFAYLFKQIITETQLATMGARIKTLETTQRTVVQRASTLNQKIRRLNRKESDRRQRQRLAGISLWN